jgi:Ala-tRNA(Pro) deacylase
MPLHKTNPDPAILQKLKDLEITFQTHQHTPFFTCADSKQFWDIHTKGRSVSNSKTLMLRNKKKTNYYMVITDCQKRVDLKALQEKINAKRLSFASAPDLEAILQVYPGCVNPFSLIHDTQNKIQLFIDQPDLEFDYQTFHPSNNEYSLELSTEDFLAYLKSVNHDPKLISL